MIACVCFCANFFLLLLHFSFFPITFCCFWRNLEEEEDSFQIRPSYTVERLILKKIFFSFSTLNDNGVANVKVRFSKTVERLINFYFYFFIFFIFLSLDDKNVAHVKLEMKTGQERCREITLLYLPHTALAAEVA